MLKTTVSWPSRPETASELSLLFKPKTCSTPAFGRNVGAGTGGGQQSVNVLGDRLERGPEIRNAALSDRDWSAIHRLLVSLKPHPV